MATFKHLEEIEAWNSARALARAIYTSSKGGRACKDYSRSGMKGMKYKSHRDANQEPRTRNQEPS